MKTFFLTIFCACLSLGGSFAQEVKNVIFMIGDGMGLNHMYAGMTGNGGRLNLEQAQTIGVQKTFSASHYTTDSAAGGTALACGVKTKNGVVGLDVDNKPVESILVLASKNGLATGIVVTSSLTDATPASYVAHQKSRDDREEIAQQMAAARVDVMIGGGMRYFGQRKDGKDLVKEMREKGKTVVETLDEVMKATKAPLVGLLDKRHLPAMVNDRGDMLPQATKKALDILSQNEKGFFLMVEGSHIDKVAHSNDANAVVQEMIDFDKAIGVAIDFAREEGNTLVIVTADHETGGMAVKNGDFEGKKVEARFTTSGHTGVPVVVYSYGPGAEKFAGVFDNTVYKERLTELLMLKSEK